MRRIMTPYRIKVVEPIKWNTKEERENIIKEADYCTGFLKAEDIPINFCHLFNPPFILAYYLIF